MLAPLLLVLLSPPELPAPTLIEASADEIPAAPATGDVTQPAAKDDGRRLPGLRPLAATRRVG